MFKHFDKKEQFLKLFPDTFFLEKKNCYKITKIINWHHVDYDYINNLPACI